MKKTTSGNKFILSIMERVRGGREGRRRELQKCDRTGKVAVRIGNDSKKAMDRETPNTAQKRHLSEYWKPVLYQLT